MKGKQRGNKDRKEEVKENERIKEVKERSIRKWKQNQRKGDLPEGSLPFGFLCHLIVPILVIYSNKELFYIFSIY